MLRTQARVHRLPRAAGVLMEQPPPRRHRPREKEHVGAAGPSAEAPLMRDPWLWEEAGCVGERT